ncbi:PLD nuclease N-terminal domain-containing protein [Streptomyces sp. NPDC003038]|uniref:PLD nuclease N-terminal domain-containing protein n=1 Tax=unclassified Streptomyces TaxID=2593676 RepID=UPI0033A1BCD3
MLRYLPILLIFALTIYSAIDCLNTPEEEVKHLPKAAWVLLILLFSIVGPLVWLFAGKKRTAVEGAEGQAGGGFGGFGGFGGGRARRTQWVAPDDNPEFLKSLRDEQERNGKDHTDDKDGKNDPDPGKDAGKDPGKGDTP